MVTRECFLDSLNVQGEMPSLVAKSAAESLQRLGVRRESPWFSIATTDADLSNFNLVVLICEQSK
jgi:hypothetical protein